MLRTSNGHLAVIDYGMMSDIPEKDRYGLIGLVIGLKLKDFSLATENLLKVCFFCFNSLLCGRAHLLHSLDFSMILLKSRSLCQGKYVLSNPSPFSNLTDTFS